MNTVTSIILLLLIIGVLFSVRTIIRDRKKGGCAGCSGCGGSCSGSHSETKQQMKSEEILKEHKS